MTEAQLHRAVSDFLSVALGGCAWFTTIPLGGGGRIRGAVLRGRGVKPGTPDLLIVDGGRCCWLELKARRGRVSPEQVECHAALRRAGSAVAVCKSLDEVIATLNLWAVPLKLSKAA